MDMPVPDSQQLSLSIPIGAFTARMHQLLQHTTRSGPSQHSRLALVHRTATLYATEAAQQAGTPHPLVDIDELTNPPLLDLPIDEADEQPVVIRFSYQHETTTVASNE